MAVYGWMAGEGEACVAATVTGRWWLARWEAGAMSEGLAQGGEAAGDSWATDLLPLMDVTL